MPLAAAPVAGFFSGCLGCMAVVESLAKDQPGCMNLMTFSHFLFVAVEGLIFTSKFFTVRRHIPVRAFWKPVLTFFLANVINNQTLNFNIPVPLYIIFRSSDLLGNLVLSRLIQKRTYSWRKYAAVFLITIGIVVCTLATSSLNTKKGEGGGIAVGVILLVIGLTLSSYLPIAQEELFAKFGRHDKEALLMNHLLPLPLFAVFWNDIVKNAASFTLSTPVDVLGISTGIPYLWLNLFVSAFLQWICLRFVYLLTASVESLTKTLFTNLRKFLSLVLSIVYFQNPFTPTHWLGTAFVFLGVLSFIDVWERKVTGKKDRIILARMTTALVPISGVLSGCIGCMIFVESIAKAQPGSMNLMTFATFSFIALEGLISTSRFFTEKRKIPFRGYLPTVTMFFFVNVINNQALNFHIPVPLHIIFRSGSLLASLLLTKLIQNKQYSLRKYLSVFAITIGIIVCTLATSNLEKGKSAFSAEEAEKHYKEWIIGVVMLTVALLASAYLAICQETMYRTYGKHSREAMFYVHSLSLPFFLFMWGDIKKSMDIFSASPNLNLLGISTGVPYLWAELLASCVLQWVCIRFVYRLNAEVESLTVTLVVTLRKFLSLLISIVWFQNPFTFTHWIGAFFVFAGTLAFADIWGGKPKTKKVE